MQVFRVALQGIVHVHTFGEVHAESASSDRACPQQVPIYHQRLAVHKGELCGKHHLFRDVAEVSQCLSRIHINVQYLKRDEDLLAMLANDEALENGVAAQC